MPTELVIPSAGESITEVQIGEWFKSEGEVVAAEEVIVEIETDKASMELPSPVAGVITKTLKKAGDTAQVGEVIAYIEQNGQPAAQPQAGARPAAGAPSEPRTSEAQRPSRDDRERQRNRPTEAAPAARAKAPGASADSPAPPPRVMPAARRVLAEQGVSATGVQGTGPGGRVLKEDALRHSDTSADAKQVEPAPAPRAPQAPRAVQAPPERRPGAQPGGGRQEEVVPMTLLRRRIAERLVEAQNNAALLTTFNEIDMSAVLEFRKRHGDAFQRQHGVKLGFMSFFVKASIEALKLIPQVNAEIRGTDIVYKNYYDVGVAVGTDRGLVVPVVRNAERLSFAEIEQVIADLAARARDKKLAVEELQGGTFTISNGGVYGSLLSTPILNPPQSGILGLHAIQQRPVAADGQVVIRPMMYVALSYDHRIVDGKESVTFLKRIKECVEDPARMLIEV